MKKTTVLLTLLLLLLLGAVLLFPVHGESEIYDSVVRLHVLANSDSEEDQAVKLQVRDAVLSVTTPLLADCGSAEEAEALLRENFPAIQTAAEETLRNAGSSDSVTLTLDRESYPERSYDSFCFPSGSYLSLRVLIGNAEGKNWWCCLFPQLCFGSSTVSKKTAENAFISVGLTPSQYKIITESDKPVYKVRFKLLEMFK